MALPQLTTCGTLSSTTYVVIAAAMADVAIKGERPTPAARFTPPVPYAPLANRNDRCPCGSGAKYKRCCRTKLILAHLAPKG